MVAGVRNNSCPLVPSGILTSSSLLQGIYLLPAKSLTADPPPTPTPAPGMGTMSLSQVTTWYLLLQTANLTESPCRHVHSKLVPLTVLRT